MLVIPAIDIKGGQCVRLLQGDPDRETVYSSDPVAMAQRFEALGARLIHVVDLDGAFEGYPVNKNMVMEISRSIAIPIEIGGGIRSREAIEEYLHAGIGRIILGSSVLDDNFDHLVEGYRDNIIVGVDAKNSMVATHGWKRVSDIAALDFIRGLGEKGIGEIIYTDISTDGMLTGPNFESVESILKAIQGISLIASGGIASIDDMHRLSEFSGLGLKGCIVGKAIYDGRIDLKEALSVFN
jgi:phosphoribosylformimino-5-aminoimidazole carboxamide ribotide isomerase